MSNKIMTLDQAAALIREGRRLLVAADAKQLERLPAGDWIGGSIPYFMGDDGGVIDREVVYVDELPEAVTAVTVKRYGADALASVPADAYDNGFSVIIVPAMTDVHLAYAQSAPDIPGIFDRPVVGWIAGVHLEDLGAEKPRVVSGVDGVVSTDEAVVLHAQLPESHAAALEIVNLFVQGDGDTLTFDETGFAQDTVRVNGEPRAFSDYLREVAHDTRLPLVADYFGAMVNASIQDVSEDGPGVALYAPVFAGVEYRLAAPVGDYVSEFEAQLPRDSVAPAFACNCILNFLYSELEGKKTGDIRGPITFGEIAYQLLNQTLVYLQIHDLG